MVAWTKEKIAEQSTDDIESLRENAARLGRHDVVDLCEKELALRKPRRKTTHQVRDNRSGQYVSEFHFVCPRELGVIRNQDGTIWTGTWVVAAQHAETAVKYASLVSLHSSRAELSYLQGTIKAWRKSPRERRYSGEQLTQIEEGIDFLIEPTDSPSDGKAMLRARKDTLGSLSLNSSRPKTRRQICNRARPRSICLLAFQRHCAGGSQIRRATSVRCGSRKCGDER
jgi:hypothetical protein